MLHLHACTTIAHLGLAAADALLVSTAIPGKMALVRFFEGDYHQLAIAIEQGQLVNAGQPLHCEEVEQWVARALGDPPPSPLKRSA